MTRRARTGCCHSNKYYLSCSPVVLSCWIFPVLFFFRLPLVPFRLSYVITHHIASYMLWSVDYVKYYSRQSTAVCLLSNCSDVCSLFVCSSQSERTKNLKSTRIVDDVNRGDDNNKNRQHTVIWCGRQTAMPLSYTLAYRSHEPVH